MFDVLAFVYENYWRDDACPEAEQLSHRLSAQGFDAQEISDALHWLDGLSLATQGVQMAARDGEEGMVVCDATEAYAPSAGAMRVYSAVEQDHLGAQCLGFLHFLDASGQLPAGLREIVIDRAMAAPGAPVSLDGLRIILLMVHWSTGIEPDALVLDELSDDHAARLAH